MADLLLGVDIGTTGTKCILLDSSGKMLAQAYKGYAVQRKAAYLAEQNAEEWWTALVHVVRQCTQDCNKSAIRAMSLSVQGGSLVLADHSGTPLAPARSWLDSRAIHEAEHVKKQFGEREFFEKTGWKVYSSYNCVQIMNVKNKDRRLFDETYYFFSTQDFLLYRLTGRACVDHNSTGITQLMNVKTKQWDTEVLDMLEIAEDNLSKLVAPGESVGALTATAAELLGLPQDVRVVAGGHDQYCAALGAGVMKAGDVLVSTGTAWVLLGITEQPLHDSKMNFALGNHVVNGTWGQFGSLRNGGVCLEWMRDNMGVTETPLGKYPASYEQVNEWVESCQLGADGLMFFPHFDGSNIPTWNHSSQGSFLGMQMGHRAPQFYRAVMEGVGMEMRWIWDTYNKLDEQKHIIRMLGGAAKSRIWTQIVANILNQTIQLPRIADSACIGAAILAGIGAGVYRDAQEGFNEMNIQVDIVDPEPHHAQLYDEQFSKYKQCFNYLKQAYTTMKG